MIDNTENLQESLPRPQTGGVKWEPAIKIFGQVSTWVVVPIVIALIGGKALDKHFGTKPILFLSFTGLAFLISCYGIVRVVKGYINKINDGK